MSDPEPETGIARPFVSFNKKHNDNCDYLGFVLPNGMKVMIVKDPNTVHSSVSVMLNAGYLSCPPNFDGLPHLVEHLFYQQTIDQLPERKFYKLIGKYGGTTNAITDYPWMTFFYKVPSLHLADTMKQFVRLFTLNPETTYTSEMLKYELSALDSEYKETMSTHFMRRHRTIQLSGNETNHKHASNRFCKGNRDTLTFGDPLRLKCIEFTKEYFKAHDMSLAIVSNYDCQQVKQLVMETFATIRQSIETESHPSDPDQYTFEVNSTTIPEIVTLCANGPDRVCRLELLFYGCDLEPLNFLVHLLNRRAPGSLLYELQTRHRFDSPKSDAASKEFNSFCFGVTRIEPFTEEEKWAFVVMFMQYVNTLKVWFTKTIEYENFEDIYLQWSIMSNLRLHYKDCRGLELAKSINDDLRKGKAFDRDFFVESNAQLPRLTEAFNIEFTNALEKFDISQLHLIEMTSQLPSEGDKLKDPIYCLDYIKRNSKTHESILTQIGNPAPNFAPPSLNPYIPDRVQMRNYSNDDAKFRTEVKSCVITKLEHDDYMFAYNRLPLLKIGLWLRSATNVAALTDDQYILFKLFITEFMNNKLELIDHAKYADIEFEIDVNSFGIQMTISGFKHKLDQFVVDLLLQFCAHTSCARTNDQFEQSKKRFQHELKFPGLLVQDKLVTRMKMLLGLNKYIKPESVSKVTFDSVVVVMKQFLSSCAIKLLVCGSTNRDHCASLRQQCQQVLQSIAPVGSILTSQQLVRFHPEVKLTTDKLTYFSEASSVDNDFETSGFLLFFQIVTRQMKDFALLLLLKLVLDPEYLDSFRYSEEHPPFGYSSNLIFWQSSHSIGFVMVMQPDAEHNYNSCSSMTAGLIEKSKGLINGLTDDEFKTKIDCLIDSIYEQLESNAFDYFCPMVKFCSDFMDTHALVQSIRSITKPELVHFLTGHFKPSNQQSRRMAINFKLSNLRYAQGVLSGSGLRDEREQRTTKRVKDINNFLTSSTKC